MDFGQAFTGFDEGVKDIGVRGGASCLRASLSVNGLRQSGIVFFFSFLDAALEGPFFHGAACVRAASLGSGFGGRAGLQPGVKRSFKAGFSLCGNAGEGDARQFAAEVGGVTLAILGMVQDGIDVVEDVPLGD